MVRKLLLTLAFLGITTTALAQITSDDLMTFGVPASVAENVVSMCQQIAVGGNFRWEFESDGDFVQDSTNGGNLQLSKAGTVLTVPAATSISAAGSNLATATQLTTLATNISTVAASTGVKLFDVTGLNGFAFAIRNSGANALTIYPPTASGTINGGSAGAGVTCATAELCILVKVATNAFVGGAVVNF